MLWRFGANEMMIMEVKMRSEAMISDFSQYGRVLIATKTNYCQGRDFSKAFESKILQSLYASITTAHTITAEHSCSILQLKCGLDIDPKQLHMV